MANLDEMDKFLEMYYLTKLEKIEIENNNRLITNEEAKTVKKSFQQAKSHGHMTSQVNSTKSLEKG